MENESVNNSDQDQGDGNARMNDMDICKCKGCHVSYKSLLKHLVKKEACHQAYSDQEMNHLKDAVKLACNAKESKRKKMNYQQDKQEILEKRKLHYQKNKISISEKRSDYYQQNLDKIVDMRAEYYLKNKEAILEKNKQRHHDKKVQEQKAKTEAEVVKGGNNEKEKNEGEGAVEIHNDEKNQRKKHRVEAEKNNQIIIRKKKPITFTMEDLERDKEAEEDKEFNVKRSQ